MNPQNDEIQKIMVSVFELTGCKVSADDPIVAMMLIQRREMAELVQQHQAQQQLFLDKLTKEANTIIDSANTFTEQKQLIIQEILNTNAKTLAENETKLFEQISKRSIEQFKTMSNGLLKDLEFRNARFNSIFRKCLFLFIFAHVVVLINSIS